MKRLVLTFAAACAGEHAPAGAPQVAPSVPVAEVQDEGWLGVVTSAATEVVPVPFAGRLEALAVYEGQPVRAGDVLARFDATELRSQIKQLKADESAARHEAGDAAGAAKGACARAVGQRRMFEGGHGTRIGRDNADGDCASAGSRSAAALDRARSIAERRALLETKLARAVLTAPIDGVVLSVTGKKGELASEGAPLVRIFDPARLVVRFAVPRADRRRIHTGQRVELRIDEDQRVLTATVERQTTERAPIDFTVVEAALDDSNKLAPDDVRVAASGHVRITTDARRGNP